MPVDKELAVGSTYLSVSSPFCLPIDRIRLPYLNESLHPSNTCDFAK